MSQQLSPSPAHKKRLSCDADLNVFAAQDAAGEARTECAHVYTTRPITGGCCAWRDMDGLSFSGCNRLRANYAVFSLCVPRVSI